MTWIGALRTHERSGAECRNIIVDLFNAHETERKDDAVKAESCLEGSVEHLGDKLSGVVEVRKTVGTMLISAFFTSMEQTLFLIYLGS